MDHNLVGQSGESAATETCRVEANVLNAECQSHRNLVHLVYVANYEATALTRMLWRGAAYVLH